MILLHCCAKSNSSDRLQRVCAFYLNDLQRLKYLYKMSSKSLHYICITLLWIFTAACHSETEVFVPKEVFHDDVLVITQVAEHTYMHTSYKQTQDFGNVPCNGAIMRNADEVIVFDTPTDTIGAQHLMKWIADALQCKIVAVVPTHFHDDCLGGLDAFHQAGIPSFAYAQTPHLADSLHHTMPKSTFTDVRHFTVGDAEIEAKYFGKGHTADNIVGYFPDDHVLFGGCLIKELEASKGYLGDAYVPQWSETVQRVKEAYPDVKIVIPGHGAYGDTALLNYTIKLFSGQPTAQPPE